MERMLRNFRRSGVTDVAFLIVNSRRPRSQIMFPALDATVSFPVYQETSDEKVWEVLGGGKDDMFIYDRCGRLVAYIPFPVSQLDRPFVLNSVLSAYHKDPCSGTPCNKTESHATPEDTGNQNYTTYFLNSTDDGNYEQDNLTSRTNEIFPGNDVNEIWPRTNETVKSRSNNTFHLHHHSPQNISHSETKNQGDFESIYNFTWEMDTLDESNTTDTNFTTFNMTKPSSLEENVENKTTCNDTDNCDTAKPFHTNDITELHNITSQLTETTQTSPKRMCVTENHKVCEQWSKRQLMRIQKCCTQIDSVLADEGSGRNENICKSFQRKRCKKLQTVIKCCIKIHTLDKNEENVNEMESSRKQGIIDFPENKSDNHADEHAGSTLESVP